MHTVSSGTHAQNRKHHTQQPASPRRQPPSTAHTHVHRHQGKEPTHHEGAPGAPTKPAPQPASPPAPHTSKPQRCGGCRGRGRQRAPAARSPKTTPCPQPHWGWPRWPAHSAPGWRAGPCARRTHATGVPSCTHRNLHGCNSCTSDHPGPLPRM